MERVTAIKTWLTGLDFNNFTINPASADASFRRYFRVVANGGTWIVMDAPPDKEPLEPFVSLARYLHALGLNVPKIHGQDKKNGFLLLSDLGKTSYLEVLDNNNCDRLYKDAIDAIVIMQAHKPEFTIPAYDRRLLKNEMELFAGWYLKRHLGTEPGGELDEVYEILIKRAWEQPAVFVHRDYHSRNLMQTRFNNPGIIDFQDAVIGPVSYDLVSLLRDCYITWDENWISHWLDYYYSRLASPRFRRESLSKWFDFMGVQRHLKAAGIFARLNYRDGKPGFMPDIPRTLGYIRKIAEKYPELAPLKKFCIIDNETVTI